MGKKLLCYGEYLLYIAILLGTTFVLRPMTWTVLSGKLYHLHKEAVLECLSHLILFLITVFVIACFFKAKNGKLFFSDFLSVFFRKILLPVLGIRFAADGLYALLSSWRLPGLIAVFVTETAALFFIFLVIQRAVAPGRNSIDKKTRYVLIGGGAALVAVVVFYVLTYQMSIAQTEYILDKYVNPSFL